MYLTPNTLVSAAIVAAGFASGVSAAFPPPVAVSDSNLLYRFPTGTWVENLVQRPNGKLLVTLISPHAAVYQIDPYCSPSNRTAQLITSFPSPAEAATGIAELDPPDTYAVNTLGLDLSGGSVSIINGTNQIWKLAFANPSATNATVTLAANVTNATLLNGVAALPWDRRTVLAADSRAGSLVAINTQTGTYKTVQTEPQLKDQPSDPNAAVNLGVNGLKTSAQGPASKSGGGNNKSAKGYAFFINSAAASFNLVPIASDGSVLPGASVTSVALNSTFADDFALVGNGAGPYGGAFVTTWVNHSIVRVRPDGQHFTAFTFPLTENGSNQTSGPVAGWFDRSDGRVLYVSTGAGDLYKLDVSKFL